MESSSHLTPTFLKTNASIVGSGNMSNKPDIKISSDGVAKLNFSFLDEMQGGDSSLEPGEVVTPPHSISPLPVPAVKPTSSLALDSSSVNVKEARRASQTEAQVCEEKVRAILELDAIKRKEELEKRKQELEKRRQSGELEREEEAKRIAKAERKRIKKIEKEQRAARLALMSDDNENEQRVQADSSKKRNRRSEDRQSYESGERVSASDEEKCSEVSPACERGEPVVRSVVNAVPTSTYHTPLPPTGHIPSFPGFRPMNLFPHNIRPDFYHSRAPYIPRGRGIRPVVGNPMRYPLYRPPFYGGGSCGGGGGGGILQLRNHGIPHTQRPQLPVRSLSPDIEVRWTKTLPFVSFSFKKNSDNKIEEKFEKSIESPNKELHDPKDHKDIKTEKKSNKKSKKDKKDKTKYDKDKYRVKSKIGKIRKSLEKSPRNKIDIESGIKLPKDHHQHDQQKDYVVEQTDKESETDNITVSSIICSTSGQETNQETKNKNKNNNDNPNTTFDIFAESPPRHTKRKHIKDCDNDLRRSCTPPIELLPSSLMECRRQVEKTHLQKTIEMQQRIGKLLQDDDLQPETLEATKEKLLQKTRNLAVDTAKQNKEIEKSQQSQEIKSKNVEISNKYVNPFKRDGDGNTQRKYRERRSRERSRERSRDRHNPRQNIFKSRSNSNKHCEISQISQRNKDQDNNNKFTQNPKRKQSHSPLNSMVKIDSSKSHSRDKIAKLDENLTSTNIIETTKISISKNKSNSKIQEKSSKKIERTKKHRNHKITPLSFNASEFLFPDDDNDDNDKSDNENNSTKDNNEEMDNNVDDDNGDDDEKEYGKDNNKKINIGFGKEKRSKTRKENSNKQNSPDTDDYMDNWELDDLDSSNTGLESTINTTTTIPTTTTAIPTTTTTIKTQLNDDVNEKLLDRYKNPSPKEIVNNNLICTDIRKSPITTTKTISTISSTSTTSTPTSVTAIKTTNQTEIKLPNPQKNDIDVDVVAVATNNENFAMQDIYNEFIKSVEATGVDMSTGGGNNNIGKRAEKRNLSTSSCSSNSSQSSTSSSSTTSSSSSSSSSSTSTDSSASAASSSSSTNSSSKHSSKNSVNHLKNIDRSPKMTEISIKLENNENIAKKANLNKKSVLTDNDKNVSPKEEKEKTEIISNTLTSKTISSMQQQQEEQQQEQQQQNQDQQKQQREREQEQSNIDPVEILLSVMPTNPTEAQKSQITKDIKRVKSYYANLKRTQMMRSNFDSSEDIFSELAKMEKLFSHAINFTIQKYTKDRKLPENIAFASASASASTSTSNLNSNANATKSFTYVEESNDQKALSSGLCKSPRPIVPSTLQIIENEKLSVEVKDFAVSLKSETESASSSMSASTSAPAPALSSSTSIDEVAAVNIFDSNRETIKLTIAPLKLTKTSAIFEKLDKSENEIQSAAAAVGNNEDTDFTETLIKTTKEVAIVKPMSKGARSPNTRRVSPRSHTSHGNSGRRSNSRSSSNTYHRNNDYRLRRSNSRSRHSAQRRSHGPPALSVSPLRRNSHSRHDSPPKRRMRNIATSPQRRYRRSRSPFRRGPHRRDLSPISRRRRLTTSGLRQYDVRSYSRSQSRSRSPNSLHYRHGGRPHSPRTPPPGAHRRSYSRERYSRSPLPFKPPSPPMRESPDHPLSSTHFRRSRSYSHSPSSPRKLPRSPRSSRSPRSPRLPRSPSSSRSPRPHTPSSQYDRHRGGHEGSYDLFRPRSPPHPHSYFTVQQNLVNIDTGMAVRGTSVSTSDYYYDLSPSQMPMEINVVLNGTESTQRHPATITSSSVYNYDSNYQYAGDTSAYLPQNSEYYSNLFMPSAQSTYSNVMQAPPNMPHQHHQHHHQHQQHPSVRPANNFYFNNPTSVHMPPSQQMHHTANSSLLKELPKATVAVQKGNVLEIVPSEVSLASPIVTQIIPTESISSNNSCAITKPIKTPKPVDPIKDEVSKRLQASAKIKEVRKNSNETSTALKSSILKKSANKQQQQSQNSDSTPTASIVSVKTELGSMLSTVKKSKKVLFEDGLFPNRDSDDEDMKDAEKLLQLEIRRVRKKGRKAATALYLLSSRKPGSKRRPTMLELSKLPPPPPPTQPLLPQLEQPVPNRPPTPPRFMFYHYDAVVNALYTSSSERGVPPRLTDPKAAAVFAASKAVGIGPTIRARASPIYSMKRDHQGSSLNALKLIGSNHHHGIRNCASPHSGLPSTSFYGPRRVNIPYHKPQILPYQPHQHQQPQPQQHQQPQLQPQQPQPQQQQQHQHSSQQQQHLFNPTHQPRFNHPIETPISTQPFSQFKTMTKTMPATFQLIKPQSPQISTTLVSPGQGPQLQLQPHHLQQKIQTSTSPVCFVNNLEIRPLPPQHPVYSMPPIGNAIHHSRCVLPPPRPMYPNMPPQTQSGANGVAIMSGSGGPQLRPQSYAYHPYVPQSPIRPPSTQHP